jgi:CO/xanthine dehydrogenase FAD-binding subunit
MEMVRSTSWADALAAKAAAPELLPIAGGTDVMVELNFDRRRPAGMLDLTGVEELATWSVAGDSVVVGAGVTYRRVVEELHELLPGLAMASRTVGSPQIRNRGTVGGNLGSASPAGDAHPPLLAAAAAVEVESARGRRRVPVAAFFVGPKRSTLEPDELIRAVVVPRATGPEQFAKIGTRNAMVIAVAAFGLRLDPVGHRVGTGIGSAGPTPLTARDAEEFLAGELDASGAWESPKSLAPGLVSRFADLVAAAAAPIDDVRGSAAYRRHALGVMAGRTLRWAWDEHRNGGRA